MSMISAPKALNITGGFGHKSGLRAEYLKADGFFSGIIVKQGLGSLRAVDKAFGTDHLGTNQPCPGFPG
jgi:hypothetical protein